MSAEKNPRRALLLSDSAGVLLYVGESNWLRLDIKLIGEGEGIITRGDLCASRREGLVPERK